MADPQGSVGGSPLTLLAVLLVLGLAETAVLVLASRRSPWAAVPPFLALGLLFSWTPRFVRRMRLPGYATLAGEVVRRWSYERQGSDSGTVTRCIAVDDGTSAVARSFEVGPELWEQLRVGTPVRVEFNARTGSIRGAWTS